MRNRLIIIIGSMVLLLLILSAYYWKHSVSKAPVAPEQHPTKPLTTGPQLVEDQQEPKPPNLNDVKRLLASDSPVERLYAARDPRLRAEILKLEGGNLQTEAAVMRGLHWLARHQNHDGSWSLDRFHRTKGCTCGSTAKLNSDAAGTSLALLAVLGTGQTHRSGTYKNTIMRGLNWLLACQKPDGDLRADSDRPAGMYAHAQATMAICEALAVSDDKELRTAGQLAIDFLVVAQHPSGGWRYRPGDQGDTSVTGWQLAALQAAQAAKLSVPPQTWERATTFLDSVQDGNSYAYQPGRVGTEVMTAEALLARLYTDWTTDDPRLQQGIEMLATHHMPSRKTANIYYWYHATQLFHHVGGQPWEQWNRQLLPILLETQAKTGHAEGSWAPGGHYDAIGGRLYATALAVGILESYYRHAPLSRAINFPVTLKPTVRPD